MMPRPPTGRARRPRLFPCTRSREWPSATRSNSRCSWALLSSSRSSTRGQLTASSGRRPLGARGCTSSRAHGDSSQRRARGLPRCPPPGPSRHQWHGVPRRSLRDAASRVRRGSWNALDGHSGAHHLGSRGPDHGVPAGGPQHMLARHGTAVPARGTFRRVHRLPPRRTIGLVPQCLRRVDRSATGARPRPPYHSQGRCASSGSAVVQVPRSAQGRTRAAMRRHDRAGHRPPQRLRILLPGPPSQEDGWVMAVLRRLPCIERAHDQGCVSDPGRR
jgi:hypothetical protein